MILALDTSGSGGAVALAEDGKVRALVRHDPARGYAESLFTLVDRALAEAGATRADLRGVAVANGPGSFTGLRIGVMTAKTLAFGADLPLWTARVPTLAAASLEPGTVVVVQAAGRGAVTVSRHDAGDPDPDPVRLDGDAWPGWVAAQDWEGVRVCRVGDDPPDLEAPAESVYRAEVASELAVRASRGESPAREVEPVGLVPWYVAPSQAERAHGVDLRDEIHRPTRPRPAGD